jgi:hypothetical protein
MTKKEFAMLKTEPLNILRIKERFALLRSGQFFLQCPILLQWKHTSQGYGLSRAKPIRKGG